MLDPLIITLIAGVLIRDALGGGAEPELSTSWGIGLGVGAPLLTALVAHLWVRTITRRLDRGGDGRLLLRAERGGLVVRVVIGGCFLAATLGAGWVDVVRSAVGDLVLIDEFLVIAPSLLALLWLWAAQHPIEVRIRDALAVRTLDADEGLRPAPTRAQLVLDNLRHRALIALVPIGIVVAWVETLRLLVSFGVERGWVALDDQRWQTGLSVAELAGVLVTLVLTPPVIRRLWNTVPLGAGELRSRIVELCQRQRVRVAEILVWHTHEAAMNAAMMGVFGPARYVLLSDTLLEALPSDELEAVVAHEAGHARRRHLPWLMATVGGVIALAGVLADILVSSLPPSIQGSSGVWIEISVIGAGVAVAMWPLGVVSRRFELQADAFAVQHLSGMTRGRPTGAPATAEAAAAMAGALARVAHAAHIPSERFTWRHGSIGARRRAALALIGTPLNAFPIDRAVRRTKLAALALLLIVALGAAWRFGIAPEHTTTDRPIFVDRSVGSVSDGVG